MVIDLYELLQLRKVLYLQTSGHGKSLASEAYELRHCCAGASLIQVRIYREGIRNYAQFCFY